MQNTDKRILRLIDVLIFQNKASRDADFCREIQLLPQTLSKIRKGTNHFTVTHIENIIQKYNVNANWIFGTDKKVFNMSGSIEISEV